MKTYISTGIGDLFFLDSILTKEEKESITEIYWKLSFWMRHEGLAGEQPSIS